MPRHIMHLLCLFQQDRAARIQLKNCSGVVHEETLFWLFFLWQPFFKLAPSSFPPLHHCPKLYMQWIWLYLSFHCLVFWGPNFPCCFFKVIHWREGPSSWQPRPYLLNLLPTFSVLLSQSYHVNHTMKLHYLFPMSSCGKRSWFP